MDKFLIVNQYSKFKMTTMLFVFLMFLSIISSFAQKPVMMVIPKDTFAMGDHIGFVDPNHPSDEIPIHTVSLDSFLIAKFELTNTEFCAFLNDMKVNNKINVKDSNVYIIGDTNLICEVGPSGKYSRIQWNGTSFSVTVNKENHPMVCVRWHGAIAYCNWLSKKYGYAECYNLTTEVCDFTKNGYRLPTEAEWEYAARGGSAPYYNYPWGNLPDTTKANWPNSKDPFEYGQMPFTTPVGFYNGQIRNKVDFNWPSAASIYKTGNCANNFGLYDVAGNAWEFVYDLYDREYYKNSPYANPTGPLVGNPMPDGKQYRCMRGGCWYNGDMNNGVDDGHSRVSNRNPSYFRGPQDPKHPWYHVGFRLAKNYEIYTGLETTAVNEILENSINIYPNPSSGNVNLYYSIQEDAFVSLDVYDFTGKLICNVVSKKQQKGKYNVTLNTESLGFYSGIFICKLTVNNNIKTIKLIINK